MTTAQTITIPTANHTDRPFQPGSATPAQVAEFRRVAAAADGGYCCHGDTELRDGDEPEGDFTMILRRFRDGSHTPITVTADGRVRKWTCRLPDVAGEPEGEGNTAEEAMAAALAAGEIDPGTVRLEWNRGDAGAGVVTPSGHTIGEITRD